MLLPDTSTSEQFDTNLAAALHGVAPAEVKPPTVLARLRKYRAVLKKYRAKGFSAAQIATALGQPPIGLTVSASLVRKAMNGGPKKPIIYRAILPPAPAQPMAPQSILRPQ